MRRLSFLTILSLASITAAAWAGASSQDNHTVIRAIAKAPAKFRSRPNPCDGNADSVSAGEKLFHQHCAECHGEDGRGLGRAADLHSPTIQNATPGQLEWFLYNGNLAAGMPSWSAFPAQRRWQIVAYLKTLR